MNNTMANDVRSQFDRAFNTIRRIIEAFPEENWLTPHGDEYYIPSSIAYHLASYIDSRVAGGYKDPDFRSKLPYGDWHGITLERLPGKSALLSYYDEAIARANNALSAINDDDISALLPPEMSRMGVSQMGAYLGMMREISAHTGEMNKMLIENGIDDIWM